MKIANVYKLQIFKIQYVVRFLLAFVLIIFHSSSKSEKQVAPNVSETYLVVNYSSSIPERYRSEYLDLDELPRMQELFNIANHYLPDYAVFFVAIKMMESGADGKPSWLAKEHNNLVGMRFPKKRETYAIASTNTNYAIYRNWFECMLDFKVYTEQIERSFESKKGRKFKDAYEMLDYFYGFYNSYEKWYNDIKYLIGYVNRKYKQSEKSQIASDVLIFD
jgi:hypothetical protein